MAEDNTELEREFMDIVREGRRKLFQGAGASIPLHMRREFLKGITLENKETGELVGTLADSDEQILKAFRRTLKKGH